MQHRWNHSDNPQVPFAPVHSGRIGSHRLDTAEALAQLRAAIGARHNILISGGTGTGKTTLLNALAASIPDRERIVIIEDTAEIQLDKPNLVRFEARREHPDSSGRHYPRLGSRNAPPSPRPHSAR